MSYRRASRSPWENLPDPVGGSGVVPECWLVKSVLAKQLMAQISK